MAGTATPSAAADNSGGAAGKSGAPGASAAIWAVKAFASVDPESDEAVTAKSVANGSPLENSGLAPTESKSAPAAAAAALAIAGGSSAGLADSACTLNSPGPGCQELSATVSASRPGAATDSVCQEATAGASAFSGSNATSNSPAALRDGGSTAAAGISGASGANVFPKELGAAVSSSSSSSFWVVVTNSSSGASSHRGLALGCGPSLPLFLGLEGLATTISAKRATAAASSVASNGFMIRASARTRCASSLRKGSNLPTVRTTGSAAVPGPSFRRWHTSKPLYPGM